MVAAKMAKEPGLGAEAACFAAGVVPLPEAEWKTRLDGLTMEGYHIHRSDSEAKRLRFLAGEAMKQLLGKAPASAIMNYLNEKIAGVSSSEGAASGSAQCARSMEVGK
jgi:hypothetical protein